MVTESLQNNQSNEQLKQSERLQKVEKEIDEIKNTNDTVEVSGLLDKGLRDEIGADKAKELLGNISKALKKNENDNNKYNETTNEFDTKGISDKGLIDLINFLLPIAKRIQEGTAKQNIENPDYTINLGNTKQIESKLTNSINKLQALGHITTHDQKIIEIFTKIVETISTPSKCTNENLHNNILTILEANLGTNNTNEIFNGNKRDSTKLKNGLEELNKRCTTYIQRREEQEKIISRHESITQTGQNFSGMSESLDGLQDLSNLTHKDINSTITYIKGLPEEERLKIYGNIMKYKNGKMGNIDENRINRIYTECFKNEKGDDIYEDKYNKRNTEQKTLNEIEEQEQGSEIFRLLDDAKFKDTEGNIDINKITNLSAFKKINNNIDESVLKKWNENRINENKKIIKNFDITTKINEFENLIITGEGKIYNKNNTKTEITDINKLVNWEYKDITKDCKNMLITETEFNKAKDEAKDSRMNTLKAKLKERDNQRIEDAKAEKKRNTPNKKNSIRQNDIVGVLRGWLMGLMDSDKEGVSGFAKWLSEKLGRSYDFKGNESIADNLSSKEKNEVLNNLQTALKDTKKLDGKSYLYETIYNNNKNEIKKIQFFLGNDPTGTISVSDSQQILEYSRAFGGRGEDSTNIDRQKLFFKYDKCSDRNVGSNTFKTNKNKSLIYCENRNETYVGKIDNIRGNNMTGTITKMGSDGQYTRYKGTFDLSNKENFLNQATSTLTMGTDGKWTDGNRTEPEQQPLSDITLNKNIEIPNDNNIKPESLLNNPPEGTEVKFKDDKGIDINDTKAQNITIEVTQQGKTQDIEITATVDTNNKTIKLEKKEQSKA